MRLAEKSWEAAGKMPVLSRSPPVQGMETLSVGESVSLASGVLDPGRFLLEARGQSMSGAGIEDRDQLLIAAEETIIAVLIGEERLTVKCLFREAGPEGEK